MKGNHQLEELLNAPEALFVSDNQKHFWWSNKKIAKSVLSVIELFDKWSASNEIDTKQQKHFQTPVCITFHMVQKHLQRSYPSYHIENYLRTKLG